MGLPIQAAGKQHRQTFHTFTGWAFVVGPLQSQCLLILQERRGLRLVYFMSLIDRLFHKISQLICTISIVKIRCTYLSHLLILCLVVEECSAELVAAA